MVCSSTSHSSALYSPVKDNEADRLRFGLLQASLDTLLYVDESALGAGLMGEVAVKNMQVFVCPGM